jgi:hypothetical protein
MGLYSSVNRGIYEHVAGAWGGPSIFLGTDEYSDIYSSVLYSSVPLLINRGIYCMAVFPVVKVCSSIIIEHLWCQPVWTNTKNWNFGVTCLCQPHEKTIFKNKKTSKPRSRPVRLRSRCWNLIKDALVYSISLRFYNWTAIEGPSNMLSEPGGLGFERASDSVLSAHRKGKRMAE